MNSLSHIAWRKFKKNSLGVFGLIIITIAVVISFLGYVLFPDSTPYSNQMHLELSKKAEEDLMQWAMDAGEIKTDDPDDFSDWLDDNLDDIIKGRIKEDVDLSEAKFNSKKELSDVAKLDKLLENAYKGMGKLQHGKSEYLRKLNDGIVEARRALDTYVDAIKSGKLDDK